MEVKYREEQVITSPYVTQADKMAVSLRHLADRFLKMEPKKQCFTPEEMTEMYDRITEKVCRGCSRKSECLERKKAEHWQLFYDLLCTIEGYGAELNKEMKQHLQRECIQAPRFLRESLETFQDAKRILVWNNMCGTAGFFCGYALPCDERSGCEYFYGSAACKKGCAAFQKGRDPDAEFRFFCG